MLAHAMFALHDQILRAFCGSERLQRLGADRQRIKLP
jgi:hypothetical protein